MDREKQAHEASTQHRELGKAGRWRDALPRGRTHHLAVQCQIVRSENTHTSKILQMERPVFKNMCEFIDLCIKYAYTCATTSNENLKESKESMGGFEGKKISGKM